jgi:hypothetical protein
MSKEHTQQIIVDGGFTENSGHPKSNRAIWKAKIQHITKDGMKERSFHGKSESDMKISAATLMEKLAGEVIKQQPLKILKIVMEVELLPPSKENKMPEGLAN